MAILIIIRVIVKSMISKTFRRLHLSPVRKKISIKILNLFLSIGAIILLTAIWGIKSEQLILFFSSALTIVGIGFFAQWSILSNITAALILYFSHPLRLGDTIRILEKDFIIEGKIEDISMFFLHLETTTGEKITIPNSTLLQKNIEIRPKPSNV